VTVTLVDPLTVAEVAVMVAVPAVTPVTSPEVLTVATFCAELVQKTLVKGLLVLLSVKVPVAVICNPLPSWMDGVGGETVMLVSVGSTKKPRQPTAPPREKRVVNATSSWSFRKLLSIVEWSRQMRLVGSVHSGAGEL
jgi:hypothetical protein